MSFGKKILGLVSLVLMLSLWGGYFYVFHDVQNGQFGDLFESSASCGIPPSSGDYKKDHLALIVNNSTQGQFSVSGWVNVSEHTFNKYELGKYELRLRLERLQSSFIDGFLIPEEVKVKPLSRNTNSPNRMAYADLESQPIRVIGEETNFPFDTYQYGYRPVLYILKGNEQIDLKFKYITTTMDLSNTFTPTRKFNPLEYFNEKSTPELELDYVPYESNECAFSIERKGSFKVIVLLLLLVICLPLMHAFYRDEPAIDFLATLVSIAAIRVFLVGPLNDFQLYNIDFVFGAGIILVGTVSLIKAMRANSRRELALKSGSSW